MAQESKLIKDFKERDVQRMRNLITKDHSAKTGVQIGYTKEHIEHKEGEIWEENGKQWTIKKGIKMTITRLDKVKRTLQMPLTCPNCHEPMSKGRIDKYMYSIHKQCSDCVIKHETQLKYEGKFEEYQRNIQKQGMVYHIKEMENVLLELAMNQSEESFVTEAGDTEQWKGKGINKQQITQDVQEYIQKLKDITYS